MSDETTQREIRLDLSSSAEQDASGSTSGEYFLLEAANIDSAVRATEDDETAFRTDEDGLFLIGEDGADAGRNNQQNSCRSYNNRTITVFPAITLAFSACLETKASFRIHANDDSKIEKHPPNRYIATPVLLEGSDSHFMNRIRRGTRTCLARFNHETFCEGARHDADSQWLLVADSETWIFNKKEGRVNPGGVHILPTFHKKQSLEERTIYNICI